MNICLESCNQCPQAMRLFNETYGQKQREGKRRHRPSYHSINTHQHKHTQALSGIV